jgi:hypothetical protein
MIGLIELEIWMFYCIAGFSYPCGVLFLEQSVIFGMHKKVNSTKNCGIFMTETRLQYLSNATGFTILSHLVCEI